MLQRHSALPLDGPHEAPELLDRHPFRQRRLPHDHFPRGDALRGELFGIPPTGRSVRLEGATFTRMGEQGLVIEDVHVTDLRALMAQLGVGA
jgi:predicted ester cyclase